MASPVTHSAATGRQRGTVFFLVAWHSWQAPANAAVDAGSDNTGWLQTMRWRRRGGGKPGPKPEAGVKTKPPSAVVDVSAAAVGRLRRSHRPIIKPPTVEVIDLPWKTDLKFLKTPTSSFISTKGT